MTSKRVTENFLALKNSNGSIQIQRNKLQDGRFIVDSRRVPFWKTKGGALRYINQAPSRELENSKWKVEDGKVKVKTLEEIKTGCEFYLAYSQDVHQFSVLEYMTIDAFAQQEKISRHFKDELNTSKKRRRE